MKYNQTNKIMGTLILIACIPALWLLARLAEILVNAFFSRKVRQEMAAPKILDQNGAQILPQLKTKQTKNRVGEKISYKHVRH